MPLPVVTESWFFSRDIQTRVWGFQGLIAAAKAWVTGTSPGKGMLKVHTWAAQVIIALNLPLSPPPPVKAL